MRKKVLSITMASIFVVFSSFSYPTTKISADVKNNKDMTSQQCGALLETEEQIQWVQDNGIDLSAKYKTSKKINARSKTVTTSLPDSVDNSKSEYFPNIISQLGGSCSSYSSVYYQFNYLMNKKLGRSSKVNTNLFSPLWVYNFLNAGNPSNGSFITDNIKVMKDVGVASVTDVPLALGDRTYTNWHSYESTQANAMKYKAGTIQYLDLNPTSQQVVFDNPKDEDLNAVKSELNSGNIFTFSTYVYDWESATAKEDPNDSKSAQYAGDVIYKSCNNNHGGAHSMTLVGYNDNIWVDINGDGSVQSGEKGAFKIANSWGTGNANKGFRWLSYDAINPQSSVDGVSNTKRNAAIWGDQLYSYSVEETPEESQLYGLLELKTANRNELRVTMEAYKDGKKVEGSNSYTFYPMESNDTLGKYSLNGYSDVATKGAYLIDLNRVVNGITKNQFKDITWKVKVTDTTNDDYAVEVKSFKLVDNDEMAYVYDGASNKIEVNGSNVTLEILPSDTTPVNNIRCDEDSSGESSINIQKYNSYRDETTNTVGYSLKVTNNGDNSIDLSKLKLNYYWTKDTTNGHNIFTDDSFTVNNYKNLVSDTRNTLIDMENPTNTADSYIQTTFKTGTLLPGDSVKINIRISSIVWLNYNQTNDYSFDKESTDYKDCTKMTAYYGDELIWGTLPQ